MWVFLKTHWYIPVIIIVGVVMKSKSDSLLKIVDIQKESYEKQLAAIADAESEKQRTKENIDKEYHTIVSALEKSYNRKKQNLGAQHKKEIKKLVKKHYNSPAKMQSEISKTLGLNYVAHKDPDNTD